MALANVSSLLAMIMAGVSAGGQAETALGNAPRNSLSAPERTSASTLAPALGLSLVARRGQALVAYSPRLLLRVPNVADSRRPLLLHRGSATLNTRPSNTTEWLAQMSSVVGELDYQAAQEVLGTSQSALPDTDRTTVLRGEAQTQLVWQAAPRWQWLWRASVERSQSLEDDSSFPTTAEFEASTGAEHQLSRRSKLELLTAAGYARLEEQRFGTWRNQVAVSHILSREVTVAGRLGASYFYPLNDAAQAFDDLPVIPVAELSVQGRFARTPNIVSTHSAALTLEPRTDPVLNRITSRVSLSWTSFVAWNAHWGTTWQLSASTNVSRQPLPGQPDETLGTVRCALEFRPSPEHVLYGGARAIQRNPHVNLGYEPEPLEYWGFVGYQLQFDLVSTRDPAAAPVE